MRLKAVFAPAALVAALSIVQRSDSLLNVGVACYDKIKAANNEVNAGIDGACRFDDFVDAWCEQPTTTTSPPRVLRTRDSSRNSRVPGLSDTSVTK